MSINFDSVFVTATGAFLPGDAVDNDSLDRYIAPLNASSARIKRRILGENGIKSRHYAIAEDGSTIYTDLPAVPDRQRFLARIELAAAR